MWIVLGVGITLLGIDEPEFCCSRLVQIGAGDGS